LLIGGIIVAVVVLYSIYHSMVSGAGDSVNNPSLFPDDELEEGTYRCSNKNTIDLILSSNTTPSTKDVPAIQAKELMKKGWICKKI
jgi:hypothetical protein